MTLCRCERVCECPTPDPGLTTEELHEWLTALAIEDVARSYGMTLEDAADTLRGVFRFAFNNLQDAFTRVSEAFLPIVEIYKQREEEAAKLAHVGPIPPLPPLPSVPPLASQRTPPAFRLPNRGARGPR